VVREAQRRSRILTKMVHTIHRITANTGWARRSSAKADFELHRFLPATVVRRACAERCRTLMPDAHILRAVSDGAHGTGKGKM